MHKIKNIAGKIKRHAISLALSPFVKKGDRKAFKESLDRAREIFKKKFPIYAYASYLMPEWLENTKKMEYYFLRSFSYNFLGNKTIKKTMFISTPKAWKDIQKAFIQSSLNPSESKKLLKEYSVGKPMLNDFEYVSSGNTIHHLYHILKFAKETGADPKKMKTVVEFGGGYGNFARLFKEMNPSVTYVIIDIPVFIYTQIVYLETILGRDAVHLVDTDEKIVAGKINLVSMDEIMEQKIARMLPHVDLFVSTWALSESNKKTQDFVKNADYFGATHLLLAYQKSNEHFAFAERIRDLGKNYVNTFSEETEYLGNNYYLFAKRK